MKTYVKRCRLCAGEFSEERPAVATCDIAIAGQGRGETFPICGECTDKYTKYTNRAEKHIVFSQDCFHCKKQFSDASEITSYRDANRFLVDGKHYSGVYLGDAYRFVCSDCKDTEENWFNHKMGDDLHAK